jgi:glyoxylase-like metal-dependent hydrolase (beta-lactamase superfamily II)
VKEVRPGVFMITDDAYESIFVITKNGVVLFDATPSVAQHIVGAVGATREPIVKLVYTLVHVDRLGGAGIVLQRNPSMERLAESGTAGLRARVARFASSHSSPHVQGSVNNRTI